ncbi:MAG: hypothetical protein ACYDAX_03620 [Desulfobacteria bacterium]
MRAVRSTEWIRKTFRWKVLVPPAAFLILGGALLGGSGAMRARAAGRFTSARLEHREWANRAAGAQALGKREAEIRSALEALGERSARKESLRGVFDPIVSPGPSGGLETKDVSYRSAPAADGSEVYTIRFSVAGSYPAAARLISRLDGGTPLAVVESFVLKRAEGKEKKVVGEVTVLVPVR